MTSLIYNSCLADTVSGAIDFSADEFRVLLCGAGYVPDKQNDGRRSDVSDEVTGMGYPPGGPFVTVDVNTDGARDQVNISLGGFSLPDVTITARYAIYYKTRGGSADEDELVAAIDFGGDVISTNGTFSLSPSILRIQN